MGGRAGLLGTALLLLAGTVTGVAQQAPPAVAEGGKDVVLTTSDGMKLAATHWRAHVPSGAGVVLLHMYRRDRTSWNPLVEPLRDRGLDVLAIDLRGHGGSAKQGDVDLADRVANRDPLLFAEMHRDAYAAVRWLVTEAKCDPKRIGIAGASVGCSVALDTVKRHPGEVAAVVCMTPGTNYLGLPSLEHAKGFPSKCALLLMSHAEEADGGTREIAALVKHAQVLVYDEGKPPPAKPGLAHGTRMFGSVPLAEQTVASFLAARTGSVTDDVVLDGIVEEEAKPGGAWTKATKVPVDPKADGKSGSAWAYRVGARFVFGGTAPSGQRCAKWTVRTSVGPPGVPGDAYLSLGFEIGLESSFVVRSSGQIEGSGAEPRGLGAPSPETAVVRVTRTANGFEYEGECRLFAPLAKAVSVAKVSVVLSTVLPPAGATDRPEPITRSADFAEVPVPSR